jgi:hypothetical protein
MHGICGDGEYCGDNDAQLGRINVFYHEAAGGKYVPRTVFFEPGIIGAVRASPLGELIRPGNFKSSQVNTLPKAKSKTRSKQNKDMHKCSSVYSERGVPLPVLTSGGE